MKNVKSLENLVKGKEYYFDDKKSDFGVFVELHPVYGAAMFTPVVNENYGVFEGVVRFSNTEAIFSKTD